MNLDRSDFRMSFVHADTGRPFTWRTPDGRSYTADTTCRNTTRKRVEDRIAATLPMMARSAGVPVTAIEGRIVEMEPKVIWPFTEERIRPERWDAINSRAKG
jgi:hypothetical protein